MAISDRINEMYTHVGDVYDTITNVDLPTNKNIQNIPSTMRSSYLEIMNNGIDTIWNNWEKVEGTGETITLNSTEEAPMKINLKGNTSQETTTGKNLLPNNQTTQTINGVTFTMNSDKSVTIKGTATANTDYYFVGTSSQYEDFGLTTGTYNFNGCTGGSEQTYMLFAVLNRNGNLYYNGSTTDSGRQMIVETGDTFRIFIRVISGTTVNKTIYPQINVGSTPLSYEPYTNGPSPSPDYPQDIHVVSGDNTIKVEGKNLLPTNASYWESGHYDTSGAKTWFDTRMRVKKLVPISPSTTYYVSNALNKRLIIREYNANKKFIYNTGAIDSGNTFTTQSNTYYLGISVEITYSEYDETTSQLFMCNNNVVDKTYEPYQSASYPISLGVENLLSTKNYGNGNSGIGITSNEENTLQVSGTATANSNILIEFNDITLKAGTYYFYLLRTKTTRVDISLRTTNNAQISSANFGNVFQNTLNNRQFILESDTIIHSINFYFPSGTVATDTYKIMICKETHTEKEFTLYGKAIELCKIGDYQDSIKKSTGKNLFDKNNANVLNGMFINASAGNIGSNANTTSIYIPINPNTTYCVSKTKGNRFAIGYSSTTPAVNVSLTNIVDDRTKTSLTSTSASDSKYLVIYISLSDTETYENIISTIQIEYGNTPTDFEPYGKVWYLNKQIGKVVLNGSESGWSYPSANRFNLDGIINDYLKENDIASYYSNYYKRYQQTSTNALFNSLVANVNYGFNLSSTGQPNYTLRIKDTRYTTVNDFKTWLSTHNTIVYYVLATPTYTEITDTTLQQQLNALEKARSYNSQTNLTQTNNDKPFILDVTALKQLTQ